MVEHKSRNLRDLGSDPAKRWAVFLKTGHSWPLFLYFRLFFLNVQLVDKNLPMLGEFKLSWN